MTRSRAVRRSFLLLGAVVLVVLAVALTVGVVFVRSSFPTTSGTISLDGLSAPVSVLRDDRGIPQIYGDTTADLARAQGYVHAQDRFFEMDLRRRIGSGRLAELVGPSGVASDKIIRTMNWRGVATAELPTLSSESRQFLQAYAEGVNAYLKGRSLKDVSLEYVLLSRGNPGLTIEDWTPVDSLVWLKGMAWDLKSDYQGELGRARLSGRIPAAQIAQIYPPYPFDSHSPIVSSTDWSPARSRSVQNSAVPRALTSGPMRAPSVGGSAASDASRLTSASAHSAYAAASAALAAIPSLLGQGDGVGSNSWVVGGDRSTTGKPILANDPHLAPSVPGIWYQNGLHCRTLSSTCPLDVAGFSFAGLPGVVIGHNTSIAWGFTNMAPDVTDFYLERINDGQVQKDGAWTPVTTRTETIKVAGGDPVTITARSTSHGPVISDVIPAVADAGDKAPTPNAGDGDEPYAVALAWTALTPNKTADAILRLNAAQNFDQFRGAARDFAAPAQNLVYADVDGHIGYQAPGVIPIRRPVFAQAPPGYWPAPGWDSSYDWTGQVAFDDLPWVLDPKEGFLVAANQAVTASTTPFLTSEWDYGFRSQRIRTLLGAKPKVSPAEVAQMQNDVRNDFAPTLVKALLTVPLTGDDFTRDGQDLLRTWDDTAPASGPSSAAAAYYNAVWSNLLRLLFNDELPKDLWADGGSRWRIAVTQLLANPRSGWWDNKLTAGIVEGKDEILRQALVQARLELTRTLGKDPTDWSWGKLHQVTASHKILGQDSSPAIVRGLFNLGSRPVGGGSAVVNANGWNAAAGYSVNWVPSMRMVVSLGTFDESTWINLTGNSGHPFADHYSDQIDDWAAGRQRPWPFTEAAVRAATEAELTLSPPATPKS